MKTSLTLLLALVLLAAGPAQGGPANLSLASAFIGSGGGPGSFSTVRAFDDMVGDQAVLSALTDLRSTFGPYQAGLFVHYFDYAVADAWNVGSRDNLKLSDLPAQSDDTVLAHSLVLAGRLPDGSFDLDRMFSRLFTPRVQNQVMQDLDTHFGAGTANAFTHMGDRFFSDIAADVNSTQPASR